KRRTGFPARPALQPSTSRQTGALGVQGLPYMPKGAKITPQKILCPGAKNTWITLVTTTAKGSIMIMDS
ncbi:MAG: hypothetical protein D6796_13930, partial [Caldilineae bacterium]